MDLDNLQLLYSLDYSPDLGKKCTIMDKHILCILLDMSPIKKLRGGGQNFGDMSSKKSSFFYALPN